MLPEEVSHSPHSSFRNKQGLGGAATATEAGGNVNPPVGSVPSLGLLLILLLLPFILSTPKGLSEQDAAFLCGVQNHPVSFSSP